MSDQYIGEIRMFAGLAGTKAPNGWAFCDGAVLSVSGNEALFALIGTVYGGDGRTNFALPDLRGRLPIHAGTLTPGGNVYNLGNSGGVETVTLVASQLPSHTHSINAASGTGKATTPNPANAMPATTTVNMYGIPTSTTTIAAMNNTSISSEGGNAAHNNMMPYLTIGFIIALQGIYPTPS
ncbi:tail fiber protein [Paenibacillus sp. KACC 21273]|uniref:phage tail protein n=1 Tax=Paenibacillus sp. KACC 21273 TaxID=3025665 RepID=UPI0023652D0B|nr:tail fiber protein [Paenibacillus sp. KACC 21273]WDF50049.1 tail fiber protein [Paenibacillus sp. KACC 21273]